MKGIKSPEFGDPYIRSNLRKFINSEFEVKQFEVGQTHARRTVGHWVSNCTSYYTTIRS